jgi:hypothetical protein
VQQCTSQFVLFIKYFQDDQIKEDQIGRFVTCTVHIKTCIKNVVRIFKGGRDYLGDIYVENKIILKLFLKKQGVRM